MGTLRNVYKARNTGVMMDGEKYSREERWENTKKWERKKNHGKHKNTTLNLKERITHYSEKKWREGGGKKRKELVGIQS